eukprot:1160906-Pelagomonas_calceolata.AAC.5
MAAHVSVQHAQSNAVFAKQFLQGKGCILAVEWAGALHPEGRSVPGDRRTKGSKEGIAGSQLPSGMLQSPTLRQSRNSGLLGLFWHGHHP